MRSALVIVLSLAASPALAEMTSCRNVAEIARKAESDAINQMYGERIVSARNSVNWREDDPTLKDKLAEIERSQKEAVTPSFQASLDRDVQCKNAEKKAAVSQNTRVDDDFNKFRAEDIYHGAVHLPQFSGRDQAYKSYRTRITEGIKTGPNFAGKYAIIEVGCGTGCRFAFVADVSSGRVFSFPLGGDDYPMLSLKYRLDSRLLSAQWQDKNESCLQASLVWSGSKFQQSTPKRIGDADACYKTLE